MAEIPFLLYMILGIMKSESYCQYNTCAAECGMLEFVFDTAIDGCGIFVGPYAINYVQMFAAIIIAIAPTVVVYCMFSNQIVEGLTTGAVKG